jgi:hypothetical protein
MLSRLRQEVEMRSRIRIISIAGRLSLLLLLVLSSAALKETTSRESLEDLWVRYNAAVVDSATYRHENLRHLFPLRFDPATMNTPVVTLTGYDYPLGPQTLSRYIWVTEVPEVQQKCQKFASEELELSLRELLGLQPEAKIGNFVAMTVKASDIFRPSPNPITTSETLCNSPDTDTTCGELFPDWVNNDHKSWIANQMLTSYLVSSTHNGAYSYPWTRLGYTYNWKPGADRYGASEYVIRPGSIVTVTSKTPYAQYCSAK